MTIHLPKWNEQYHSKHGAIAEAKHVFIESGLAPLRKHSFSPLKILEIGFGTGLNAYLTLLEAEEWQWQVTYDGIEAYPVDSSEIEKLNYPELLGASVERFLKMHDSEWNEGIQITPHFQLQKRQILFNEIHNVSAYHLIYFDAFGPRVQPELWTEAIFRLMYSALKPGGVLVTYSAKGSVRRAMQSVGFVVERLPGPPFKREMLRASKPS